MISPENVMPAWVTQARVHSGCCTGVRNSLRVVISQQHHVNAKRPHVSVWNQSAGRLEQVANTLCMRFWITHLFYQHDVYLQIVRYEMSQSSCKHDTKSNSHPSVKLAPVRVFSCKHPLLSKISSLLEIWGEILAPFCSTDFTLNTPNISRIC